MENPIKLDGLGVPLFSETSIYIHIYICTIIMENPVKLDDLGVPLLFSETLKLDSQKSALMWATNHPIFFYRGHYNTTPSQTSCTSVREIPENYHTFTLFDAPLR